jgi:hypothetical protein
MTDSRIPAALTRTSANGAGFDPRRKHEPTEREFAMMGPAELKQFLQSTGRWPTVDPDAQREAIAARIRDNASLFPRQERDSRRRQVSTDFVPEAEDEDEDEG